MSERDELERFECNPWSVVPGWYRVITAVGVCLGLAAIWGGL